jgi:hypothetical protein
MGQGRGQGGLERAGDILLRKYLAEGGPKTKGAEQPLLPLLEEAASEPEPALQSALARTRPLKVVNPEIFTDSGLIRPEDILYVHSIFLQCFMPVRHNAMNRQRWETGNREAKLLIRAGELVNPNDPGQFKECVVPAGPKARIITAYINDYAYKNGPEIDLADSMRDFMTRAGIPVCGSNGKELQRELENVAAADIYLGFWNPGTSAAQRKTPVSEDFTFWIDKDPRQGTLWKQKMVLSQRYYEAIMHGQHLAPIHWPAYRNLQHSPRAMDIFAFMSYRLRTIPHNRPILLDAPTLHAMFGRDIKLRKHFWPRFLTALDDAAAQYQTARYDILNDAIRFWHSPPIIPHKKTGRIAAP